MTDNPLQNGSLSSILHPRCRLPADVLTYAALIPSTPCQRRTKSKS